MCLFPRYSYTAMTFLAGVVVDYYTYSRAYAY